MHKYSLLYVDDEQSNLRIFKDTFRRKFTVHTAPSAEEGMKILDQHKIDLVLSDQRMPEMTGVEFLKYTLKKYPGPNRILITGFSDMDAIENAVNEAHIFQYIQKPWDENELLNIIEQALKIYQLEQENEKQKQELIEAQRKAEESDHLKTQFLNNLSHEIRTPMNGIIGFSNFLGEKGVEDDDRDHYIEIIQKCSGKLLRIIDDILEISGLATQQIKIEKNKVLLNRMITELCSKFKSFTHKKNIKLDSRSALSDSDSYIYTDEAKLQRILNNLLENSIKFTEEGSIEIGYTVENDQLQFYVRDTGIGIEQDQYDLIFETFTQGKSQSNKLFGGLGLGLSIVKETVKLISGNISFESKKGKGSTFYVTIPYQPVSGKNIEKNSQFSNEEGFKRILIAEDDEINYLYLKKLIELKIQSKCEIFHAINGQEAVDIINKEGEIDFVFMDIKMPVMNGFEATKVIKKNHPEIPIVFQTSYSTQDNLEMAKMVGSDDFITKPVSKELFMKIIHKYL